VNEQSATRKVLNLVDSIANIANEWLDTNTKHSIVNYLNSKLDTEE
tara:strand:+ start:2118 stop:2255 length:138 start_codon:yes stop_codon:yes gene_type:complete